ncbi:MAG: type II toxin-antitoxin system YafQ family toxin [Defluviitaleaceae bacterium]|nr:type II toxin-antitoxin system YafQ family toxin [Defluviitaleaceae bacterium]
MTTKYEVKQTSRFKRDYKRIKKRNYDVSLLEEPISLLANGKPLPAKYKDHALHGNLRGLRECHITPDWLLIYEIDDNKLYLYLTRTGTHSDLLE